MSGHCAVYASVSDFPRALVAEAARATGGRIDESAGGENDWTSIEVAWEGGRVHVNRMTDRAERLEHLNGFAGYVLHHCNGGKMTAPTYALIDRVLRTKHVLGIESEPAFGGPAVELVRALCKRTRSLLFLSDHVLDDEERALAAPDGKVDPTAQLPRFPSSLERKARSEARLRAMNIQVPPHLPPIQGTEETVIRDARSVVGRLSCVFAVAGRGVGMDRATAKQIADPRSITEAERAVLEADYVNRDDAVQLGWQIEAAGTFLWALGKIASIGDLSQPLDAARTGDLMMQVDPRKLVAGGLARKKEELLDEADFFYRLHWATTDARVNGGPAPANVDPGVVIERRRALQWLTSHRDADWDDVALDT